MNKEYFNNRGKHSVRFNNIKDRVTVNIDALLLSPQSFDATQIAQYLQGNPNDVAVI